MRICIVGAGYVGLTTAAFLADFDHEVVCVDIEESKIQSLCQGIVPIYEPGLEELIKKNLKNTKLRFSAQVKENIRDYPIIMIAVGTPAMENGGCNLTFLNQVVEVIVSEIQEYKLIITKSTVPPGTNQLICQQILETGIDEDLFDIVSNPEFLREGTALWDINHPNKIVFGTKTNRPIGTLKNLYREGKAPVIFTDLCGAELIKYASNAFLATKISFANEIARICDAYEVDYSHVAKGLATDPRIGRHFLNAGLGFGGSCLPKDLSTLKYCSVLKNVETKLLDAVLEINQTQIELYLRKLSSLLPDLSNKVICVWGGTFKPGTDDIRSSPAVALIKRLVQKGCLVHSYDPKVQLKLTNVTPFNDLYESIKSADALIIATEWEEFINLDWTNVKSKMKGSIILDTRNCLDVRMVRKSGLVYLGVGKQ